MLPWYKDTGAENVDLHGLQKLMRSQEDVFIAADQIIWKCLMQIQIS